jgi:urea carboxylase-associated protein 2
MASNPNPPRDRVLFEKDIHGGGMWSYVLKRHQTLRVVDLEGGANVGVLLYNRDLLLERYNMPDTLKAQYTAFLTKGRVLLSDMGRILCSISEDTCGWHDTIAGHMDGAASTAKYGEKTYQQHRNDFQRNAHDDFLIELGKWGLGKRDLVPNLNLFSKVTAAGDDGRLQFHPGNSRSGDFVDLRAEMNVLVVLNTCPHPLDPAPTYAPRKVKLLVWRSDPPGPDDVCRTSRAEAARGFENTERYFL